MEQSPETQATERTHKVSPFVKEIVRLVGTAILVLVICQDVFVFHIIPSASMEPAIKTNSFALCWRLPYWIGKGSPSYGDIVSFRNAEKNRILIKRVIGLPGDTIEFHDGYVFRNGEQISEPYLQEQGKTFYIHSECTYVVPDGTVFVLGDNREHSSDSRALINPYIPFEDLYAKLLWSFALPRS